MRSKVTEQAVEKTAISKAWLIEKLAENIERAMQAEPVRRKTGDGEEEVAGECVYNGSVANKAFELLGEELHEPEGLSRLRENLADEAEQLLLTLDIDCYAVRESATGSAPASAEYGMCRKKAHTMAAKRLSRARP